MGGPETLTSVTERAALGKNASPWAALKTSGPAVLFVETSNDDTSRLGNCELASQSMLKLCVCSSTGSDLTSLCEIRPAKTTPSHKPPVRTLTASLWRLEAPLSHPLIGSNWFRLVPGEGCRAGEGARSRSWSGDYHSGAPGSGTRSCSPTSPVWTFVTFVIGAFLLFLTATRGQIHPAATATAGTHWLLLWSMGTTMHFLFWCSEEPTLTVSLDGRKCHAHWADLELHGHIFSLLIIINIAHCLSLSAVIHILLLILISSNILLGSPSCWSQSSTDRYIMSEDHCSHHQGAAHAFAIIMTH